MIVQHCIGSSSLSQKLLGTNFCTFYLPWLLEPTVFLTVHLANLNASDANVNTLSVVGSTYLGSTRHRRNSASGPISFRTSRMFGRVLNIHIFGTFNNWSLKRIKYTISLVASFYFIVVSFPIPSL